MKRALLFGGFALATTMPAAITYTERAEACGGCFVAESENTQVTGHRMVMSISPEQTTLYDQITYTGAPEEFAWILPIRGQVDVGLSSDALFETLEVATEVVVRAPVITCAQPPDCGFDGDGQGGSGAGDSGTGGAGGGGGADPVEIIAAEVVGPYETVQLSSSDPDALLAWLELKGFAVPEEIEPTINEYVEEGFDFLALRLVPGQGVAAMRPVRITTPGATPELPLRMVAAGTGAKTIVNLWIVAEGRYEPQNFSTFEITEEDLIWNWSTQSSNYVALRAQHFADSEGMAWHARTSNPQSTHVFSELVNLADYEPEASGYGTDGGSALVEAEADMAVLLAGIPASNLWISHLVAELPREALATDLLLQASIPQVALERVLNVQQTTGNAPECPTFDPCDEDDDGSDDDGDWWNGDDDGGSNGASGSSGGCAASQGSPHGALILCALMLIALRRTRKRATSNLGTTPLCRRGGEDDHRR